MELPWNSVIPNFYQSSFYVETWTRPHLLPNICDKYSVFNIKLLNFDGEEMKDTKDHSKWGVSDKGDIICYGDMNRTEEQEKRQGSIACFRNNNVAGIVRGFIPESEQCGSSMKFLSS